MKVIDEFAYLLRHGKWHCAWHKPPIFSIGRDWYDGPIWHAHLGYFSISWYRGYKNNATLQQTER